MAKVVYSVCAVLGGTILLCQFVMTLIGLDHTDAPDDVGGAGGDFPHDFHDGGGHDGGGGDVEAHDGGAGHHEHAHSSSWLFGILTFRTVVAALTFFGLVGLAAGEFQLPSSFGFVLALGGGFAAMYGVHWLMRTLYRLRADGTVRIERAIGRCGTVYLRIPPNMGGAGKVQMNVQNRTMEYEALTNAQDELPVGARVVVVNVMGPDTVEVELVPEHERTSHA